MDPDKLTRPERALWEAFPRGELVDLSGARGAAARTVRAEVIAALLLGAVTPDQGRVAAVRLDGARVTGTLNLGHAVIPAPLQLRHCEFNAVIELPGVRTREIDLTGLKLPGLRAPLAQVEGNLCLVECQCSGQVVLTGAHIAGALQMREAHLDYPGGVALLANRIVIDDDLFADRTFVNGELDLAGARVGGVLVLIGSTLRNEGRRALYANNLSVGTGLLARFGFSATGEVALIHATIGKILDFRGAVLRNPGGCALDARELETGSHLSLGDGFSALGELRLSRARIGATIFLAGGTVHNPGADAIRCRKAQGRSLVLGPGLVIDGMVDLSSAKFETIHDDQACWPHQMRLSGLSYDTLDPALPASQRVRWLRRDVDGYLPQNYETLAAMYRRLGDDAGARTVLLARERERREHLPRYHQAWSWLQEVTVGYGYRPLRACAWLAASLAMGTLVFGLHHPTPLAGAPHPAFNPLIFSVDLLVPLVNLGMRSAYDPQGPQRWLAYLLIAVGWIFATTIAAGIARVLRRQ